MKMLPLLLMGVLSQQPSPAPASPHPARPSAAPRSGSLDSTVAVVSDLGVKVGSLRSIYDLYRRAAYNEPDGALMERVDMYQNSCRELAAAAERGEHTMCRNCMAKHVQAAMDAYRAYLPTLQHFAQTCAVRFTTLKAHGTPTTQSKILSTEVNPAGARMVETLRGYETRLGAVRVAMGWAAPNAPTLRRSN